MVVLYSYLLQFKQKPNIILLDCSKLQLGRGRLDDSVTAFRRRLEIFRQSSLPMLKTMDNIGRLTIVSITQVDMTSEFIEIFELFLKTALMTLYLLSGRWWYRYGTCSRRLQERNTRTHAIRNSIKRWTKPASTKWFSPQRERSHHSNVQRAHSKRRAYCQRSHPWP